MRSERPLGKRDLRAIRAAAQRIAQDAEDLRESHTILGGPKIGKVRPYRVKLEIEQLQRLAYRLRVIGLRRPAA